MLLVWSPVLPTNLPVPISVSCLPLLSFIIFTTLTPHFFPFNFSIFSYVSTDQELVSPCLSPVYLFCLSEYLHFIILFLGHIPCIVYFQLHVSLVFLSHTHTWWTDCVCSVLTILTRRQNHSAIIQLGEKSKYWHSEFSAFHLHSLDFDWLSTRSFLFTSEILELWSSEVDQIFSQCCQTSHWFDWNPSHTLYLCLGCS